MFNLCMLLLILHQIKRTSVLINELEDVLNELCEIKGNKAKIFNNNALETDSCGLSHESKDSMIDEQLSNTLGKQPSNYGFSEVRKTMQEGKVRLTLRKSLTSKKNYTACESFKTKWNDEEMGKDGHKIDLELEN